MLVSEADRGVAPVIVMPTVPRVDRRRDITKRDVAKYGYPDESQPCTQLAACVHKAKVPPDDRCRGFIGELVAEDEDLKQGYRVASRPGEEDAGDEIDVSEPTIRPSNSHISRGWILKFEFESKLDQHR